MKRTSSLFKLASFFAILLFANSQLFAALTIGSGLGTTHTNNIVTNGSFENATFPTPAPLDGGANAYFWANSSLSPYILPDGWTSNGGGDFAQWGNDGSTLPYRLKASAPLPDGRLGMAFRTGTGTIVTQPPTFHPNGEVTFPNPPAFITTGNPPVSLKQTVHTELFPQPSYNLSFWISGEEISTNQGFNGLGIIGFQMSNVLPGNPIQFLTVPNGLGPFGQSHLYEFTFTPLNSSLPVDIRFINWGGVDLSAYSMPQFGVQPILDDVIINAAVPEPSSWILMIGVTIGGLFFVSRRRTKSSALNHLKILKDV